MEEGSKGRGKGPRLPTPMVKSNFERADRATVVRTTSNYTTSLVPLLSSFKDLLFN